MTTRSPATDDATGLALRIKGGETSAAEAMDAALARAAEWEHGGSLSLDPATARRDAARIDEGFALRPGRFRRMPFAGVPMLLTREKDAAALDGSELVRRFRRAGLVIAGTVAAPEPVLRFTESAEIGAGLAAAIAAGVMTIGHATDATGAVRAAAARTGIPALKCSRGALPAGPDFATDLLGLGAGAFVGRSLRDLAAALDRFAGDADGIGGDPDLDTPALPILDRRPERLKVGIGAPDASVEGLGTSDAVARAGDILADAGHLILSLDGAGLENMTREAAGVAATLVRSVAGHSGLTAADLRDALMRLTLLSHACWTLFADIDVLLMPTPADAAPLDGSAGTVTSPGATASLASLANVGGLPALTVPHGRAHDGAPAAVHLMGPIGSDGLLLRIGRVLESAAPWRLPAQVAGVG